MKKLIYLFLVSLLTFHSNSFSQIKVANSGRVGIGNTNVSTTNQVLISSSNNTDRALFIQFSPPTALWHQSMSTEVNKVETGNYVVRFNGSDKFWVQGNGILCAAGTYFPSDISLKNNIRSISSPLSKVLNLRGVIYNYKPEKDINGNGEIIDKDNYMGFIAQEVEAVIPEVVKDLPNKMKGVAYSNIAALLVEAIKEQHQLVSDQNAKLEKISVELESLKTKLKECCSAETNPSDSKAIKKREMPFLYQNRPNPFDEETVIKYFLPYDSGKAFLKIYSMDGKLLQNIELNNKGTAEITISANSLKPGVYIYHFVQDNISIDSKLMTIVKH